MPQPKWRGIRCVLVVTVPLAAACTASTTGPTPGSASPATFSVVAGTVSPSIAARESAALTPSLLVERGWSCRQPPIPNRIVCSHPNQGFPTAGNPPPADRPATFTLLAFDGAGTFIGTQLLIRSDLYNGQRCGPSDAPFILRPPIGYYECVHLGA